MRGCLTREEYEQELKLTRNTLERVGAPHWTEFLSLWPQ